MFFARAASFRCSAPRRTAGEILKNRGYGRSGNESGPLRDLPDWEFADGTPAPVSKGRKRGEYLKKRTEEQIAAARAAFPSDPEQLRIAILEGKKGIYKREFEKKDAEEKAMRKAAAAQRKKEQKATKTKADSKEEKADSKEEAKPKTSKIKEDKAQKSKKPADEKPSEETKKD